LSTWKIGILAYLLCSACLEFVSSRRSDLVRTCRELAGGRPPGETRALLEGAHLVREALAAGVPLQVAAVTSERLERHEETAELVRDLDRLGVRIVRVTADVMDAASPTRTPSGLLAIAQPACAAIGQLFRPPPALVIVLVDIQDPGNVGAVIRAAEAGGATGVLAGGATSDPFGWKALRGAMGSAFRLPVVLERDTSVAIAAIRRRHVRILAAEAREGDSLFATDLRGPVAVLLGNEGAGLSGAVAGQADARLRIPMQPGIESLNVAVASGVIVYEGLRQRAHAADPGTPA
jgi:RNA methyltransferase, TrmH family